MKCILARIALTLGLVLPVQAATVVFDGIASAENQFTASNGRWFVTGDGGIYEGQYDGRVYSKHLLTARLADGSAHSCYFLGMAERTGKLYTICTDSSLNPLAAKYLFSLDLADPAAELHEVYRPGGMSLPNGLAAAADGSLIAADAGLPLLPGKLVRFTFDAAGQVAGQGDLHQFPLCKPNGVRIDGDKLYVSLDPMTYVGLSQLKRYRLAGDTVRDDGTLYTAWTLFDDFALSTDGVVIAEFLGGKITHVSEGGTVLKTASYSQPTSVMLSKGGAFPAGATTVTERGNGRVLLDAGFGAWPR